MGISNGESERREYKGSRHEDKKAQEVQSLFGHVVKYTAALSFTRPLLTSLLEALAELHLQELELPFNYR